MLKDVAETESRTKMTFTIPIFTEYSLRELEKFCKEDMEEVYGGAIKKMGTVRTVERFVRKAVTSEFETEEEKREARCFTIAFLAVIEAIDMDLVEKLIHDENEDIYIKMAIVHITNGRAEVTSDTIKCFKDICNKKVVSKVFDILSEYEDICNAVLYDTVKLMIDELPDDDEANPKNLPAIIEQPYHSFRSGDSESGKISRKDWYDLDKVFGEILNGFNYTFFKINNDETKIKTTVLRLFDQTGVNIIAERIVDTGSIMGLGICLEVPTFIEGRYDSVYCSVEKHPDICKWSLLYPQSPIPDEYVKAVFEDMLLDPRIYFYVDFNEVSLKDLSKADYKKFSKNMTKILNTFFKNNTPTYRMTLTEFANVDKFELVSDSDTEVHRDSCMYIAPIPTIVKFEKGKIEVIQNEHSTEFPDDAESNGSVYGPYMNGLFSNLIIR